MAFLPCAARFTMKALNYGSDYGCDYDSGQEIVLTAVPAAGGEAWPRLRDSGFDFNDETLERGVSLLVALALGYGNA